MAWKFFFGDGDSGADLLEVHQHDPWVLNGVLDSSQKGDSLATVDQAVVIGESNVHHRADDNLRKSHLDKKDKTSNIQEGTALYLAIPDNGPLKDTVHAKDCRLGWVDNRGSEQGTKHAAVAKSCKCFNQYKCKLQAS